MQPSAASGTHTHGTQLPFSTGSSYIPTVSPGVHTYQWGPEGRTHQCCLSTFVRPPLWRREAEDATKPWVLDPVTGCASCYAFGYFPFRLDQVEVFIQEKIDVQTCSYSVWVVVGRVVVCKSYTSFFRLSLTRQPRRRSCPCPYRRTWTCCQPSFRCA